MITPIDSQVQMMTKKRTFSPEFRLEAAQLQMMTKKRTFSPEFRLEAAQLMRRQLLWPLGDN
ncbi:hypothetical protein CK498_24220 [Halomonas salipaludis]|uniref:Uncharacterized protein n=1 Tax=Halomonas salipaludis TaxID=2032625 RepID=A0A2A2ENI6_9GAMM|nr:hypothetical protein CK498_24220 [Halomonas salipaludis]